MKHFIITLILIFFIPVQNVYSGDINSKEEAFNILADLLGCVDDDTSKYYGILCKYFQSGDFGIPGRKYHESRNWTSINRDQKSDCRIPFSAITKVELEDESGFFSTKYNVRIHFDRVYCLAFGSNHGWSFDSLRHAERVRDSFLFLMRR